MAEKLIDEVLAGICVLNVDVREGKVRCYGECVNGGMDSHMGICMAMAGLADWLVGAAVT